MQRRILFLILFFVWMATNVHSMDRVRLAEKFSPNNRSYAYGYAVLVKALEATVGSDGPFTLSHVETGMERGRILRELAEVDSINVHLAATREEWESASLPVRIPVLKGLLGYRLFLIRKDDIYEFKHIRDVGELKKLRAGLGQQWSTTAVLKEAGFNVVTGMDYEGLFGMLHLNRFDYFPRGVNEIFFELEARQEQYPDLWIEDSLVLYFPTPSYFFVSPRSPHLAKRLKRGMEILIETGVFDKMFNAEFGKFISRANIKNRKLLTIDNPFLTKETPFDRPELWYSP